MKHRLVYLNIIIVTVGLPLILAMYLLPFSEFVDIKYEDYQNVCEGETVQTVFSLRHVHWSPAYEAHVEAELVRYEEDYVRETVIRRKADFIYQQSDGPVAYEIEWSDGLPAGRYGVNSLITIDPFFEKEEYRPSQGVQFVVYPCN